MKDSKSYTDKELDNLIDKNLTVGEKDNLLKRMVDCGDGDIALYAELLQGSRFFIEGILEDIEVEIQKGKEIESLKIEEENKEKDLNPESEKDGEYNIEYENEHE